MKSHISCRQVDRPIVSLATTIGRSLPLSVLILLAGHLAMQLASGETFVMKTGGRFEGALLNPDQSPRVTYRVRTDEGIEVSLQADQVEKVIVPSPELAAYRHFLKKMPDTAEGHWTMANWCKEKRLYDQRAFHLEQVLRLDGDHAEARRALGFSLLDGKWVKSDEVMAARGFVRYGGRWKLPMEVELEKAKRQRDLAEKQWMKQLRRLRSQLNGRRGKDAYEEIIGIDDPTAVTAATALMLSDSDPDVQKLMIGVLSRAKTTDSVAALIKGALQLDRQGNREMCLRSLTEFGSDYAVTALIGNLDSRNLKNLRRAAEGLAYLKDPQAIRPLIDFLVTTHVVAVGPPPGQMSASFGGPNGGLGGLSTGGRQKTEKRNVENRTVLNALLALTDGVNFQYDEEAWRQWYARRGLPSEVNLRRSE